MTEYDLKKAAAAKTGRNEDYLFSHVGPGADYGFVITIDRCQSTNSLRRYHVMETVNEFGVKCCDVVQIDSVSWIEDWNFYHDEAVQ